jgi:hypothetical protein
LDQNKKTGVPTHFSEILNFSKILPFLDIFIVNGNSTSIRKRFENIAVAQRTSMKIQNGAQIQDGRQNVFIF